MSSLHLPLLTRFSALSPLLPPDIKHALTDAIKKIDKSLPTKNTERILVDVGRKVWPYHKAFLTMLSSAEDRLGVDFFVSFLSKPLKKWFKAFQSHGGTLIHLHRGGDHMILHLTPDERTEIVHALMETRHSLFATALQEILSHNRSLFENQVILYKKTLSKIEQRIDHIKEMAQQEKNRALAAEMNALAHDCELVFAGLAPTALLDHLHHAPENFEGRRSDKIFHASFSPTKHRPAKPRRTIFDFSAE